MLFRY